MKNKYVIGDIRGDLNLLQKMMDRLGPTENDVVIFTGSYIGPGPNSKGVLDYLINLKKQHPERFIFLAGCYETVLGLILSENAPINAKNLWKTMNGMKVFESYQTPDGIKLNMPSGKISHINMKFALPKDHLDFMKSAGLWWMDTDFPFAVFHAGPDITNWPNPRQERVVLGDNEWWNSSFEIPENNIIFSHIPFKTPFYKNGKIGIDLGCGVGINRLCAYSAHRDSFIIVER